MTSLLLIFAPIIVFTIVDAVAPLKTALISAVAIAALEVGYTYYKFGELDAITFIVLFLVVALAGLSFVKESPLFFKLKPAVMSFIFGAVLVGSYLLDEPMMKTFMNKYGDVMRENVGEMSPI
ncbi:MAG: septation protein IspZ [Bdellovibrionales bacterium]